MQANQIWKSALIALAVLAAGLSLYPLDKTLIPGLDLAGGTVFVYQVEVKRLDDPKTVLDSVLNVIRKRLDPSGVRNLVFRPLAGNRIEIQVPLAPKETDQLRRDYNDAHKQLMKSNMSLSRVDSAMRQSPAEKRNAQLDRIASDRTDVRAQLEQMAKAFDALTRAKTAFDRISAELSEASARRSSLPQSATDEERRQLGETIADLAERVEPLGEA